MGDVHFAALMAGMGVTGTTMAEWTCVRIIVAGKWVWA